MKTTNLQSYAPILLRYGMCIVILWFSIQQFLHPDVWVAYVPDGAVSASHLSATTLVYINATFEGVFGLLLLVGYQTRWVALLLALHLFDIMWVVGYGQIAVRDFGLAIATLSISLYGSDKLCLDYKELQEIEVISQPESRPLQKRI